MKSHMLMMSQCNGLYSIHGDLTGILFQHDCVTEVHEILVNIKFNILHSCN